MASLKEVRDQIEAANDIGRENLAEKGVTLPESATTSEIMKGIKNINVSPGGGSVPGEMLYDPEGVGF